MSEDQTPLSQVWNTIVVFTLLRLFHDSVYSKYLSMLLGVKWDDPAMYVVGSSLGCISGVASPSPLPLGIIWSTGGARSQE
jgi:hypothetical protein